MGKIILRAAAMMAASAAGFIVSAPAQADTRGVSGQEQCTRLMGLRSEQVNIESAAVTLAGAEVPGARLPDMMSEPRGAPVKGLQAFCRVSGSLHPEKGSNTRFEVWLPTQNWNGRLFAANNGGLAGAMRYDDLAAAVANGAVGAGTDGGHNSSVRNWSKDHPELVRDYGWRANHVVTVLAKNFSRSFYGQAPRKSYFVGCSNGGRMGLIAASRFPSDFDGIVAGAPVPSWTDSAMNGLHIARVQKAPGAIIRPAQARLLQREVLNQCDALDGVRDGLVVDPRQCRFDYSRLACGTADAALCFSAPQLTALRQITAGPQDSSGRRVAWPFILSGGEVGLDNVGWDTTILSSRGSVAGTFLQDFPAQPIATEDSFDFDRHPARFRSEVGSDLDASPNLRKFFGRGGKLIMWHGWSDSILSPLAALNYYQEAARFSGPRGTSSARMFMIPGMQHCTGGPGADSFGQIGAPSPASSPANNVAAAMVEWVERGRVPETLVGRHGNAMISKGQIPPGKPMERLHCAYPKVPVLAPGADRDRAESYTCRTRRAS
jgi:hypothetical protein